MINEYLDGLQKEKDLKDRTLALEKARFALEKAKNNLTKKYGTEASGYTQPIQKPYSPHRKHMMMPRMRN